MLTPAAAKALNISSESDLPPGGRFEKDASGKPTGAVTGGQGAIVALFDRLPRPTFDQQVEGTKLFFRELNRLGLTGVVDPGGNNLMPDDYQALAKLGVDVKGKIVIARYGKSWRGIKPKVAYEHGRLGTLMLQLEDAFPDAHMDRTDGLKLIWPDRWIHVRSSNTEPLLRFSAEGKTEETMDELYKEVERLLK